MPNFCHPGQPPTEIYPDRATRLIEELRRFVGHDRLVQQTNHYHAEGRITNLVRMARFREDQRSEEHTSELQSLMRISYAVFCLKKKKKTQTITLQDTAYVHNR